MQGSFKVGTIAGIDIRIHYTWLPAIVLIAWSLASGYFPMAGQSQVADWLLGIVAAFLLFASVLVHELGHSLVATARGIRVDNITLFIFGGVSSITREATTARDEFLIAVVGPLTSLALAAVFWAVGLFLPVDSAASAVVGYVAYTNLVLGLFNIVPGFPLDGGRVLRSIIWAATGSMTRATQIASYVGQAVAFALIGWGVLRVLGGDVAGGLWIGFIGWFLNTGAEASRQQLTVQGALERVPVGGIMGRPPRHVSPDVSVGDFVEYALAGGQRALPVLDSGQLVGIMSVTDASHLQQHAWATTRVGDVMTRVVKTLDPDADLAAALHLMVDNDIHQVPIVNQGQVVGMVTRADVMRALHLAKSPASRSSAQAESLSPTPTPGVAGSHG